MKEFRKKGNMKKTYKWLFFDLDATIWNFHENSRTTLRFLFDRYKLSCFFNSFDEFYGLYSERNDYLWSLYAQGKIRREDLEAERFAYPFLQKSLNLPMVAEAMREEYLPVLAKQTVLEDGAVEILDYLVSSGYILYVISNGFREVQYEKLANSGLDGYFESVYLSEEIGAAKPSPLFFEAAIGNSGAGKTRSLVIGDNFSTDIAGARNSGIDQVFYNPQRKQAGDFVPTYEISSLRELRGIL